MKKLLGVLVLLIIISTISYEKIIEKYLIYKFSNWVEKDVSFESFNFDYPNKIILKGLKIKNSNPIFYNDIFQSNEIFLKIDLKSYFFSQLVIIKELKIYKSIFFLKLIKKKNLEKSAEKEEAISFEDNIGIAKKINENLPDRIWPSKIRDKNFLIQKSLIDKGVVFFKVNSIDEPSEIELSDFNLKNIGNEKGLFHYKDVLKLIFFDFYAREKDLNKKKILKKAYKF